MQLKKLFIFGMLLGAVASAQVARQPFLFQAPPSTIDIWADLFAGWKLDETSDGSSPVSRADVLGNYTLTDNGTTASASGLIGNAGLFVIADTTYLSATVPDSAGGDFTISYWVNVTNASLVFSGVSHGKIFGGGDMAMYSQGATDLTFRYEDSGAETSTSRTYNWVNSTWQHVVIVRSGSTFTPYFDGSALSTISHTPTNVTEQGFVVGNMFVGGTPSYPLGGMVDEIYIYHVAKDQDWVTAMYNGGAGRQYPN